MDTPNKFDPTTGRLMMNPPIKPRKKISPKLVVCLIAGAVLLLGLIFVLLYIFYFDNGKVAVATAFANTIEEYQEKNELYKTLNIKDITNDKEYTLEMDIDTEIPKIGDVSVFAEGAVKDDVIGVSGDVDLSFIPPVEYTIQVDEKMVKAQSPLLKDYLFVYDYHKDNDGYLMSYISDPETLNAYISKVYAIACNGKSADLMKERFAKILTEEFGDLRMPKALSKTYVIDNTEVRCKGYKATFDSEKLESFSGKISEYVKEYFYDSLKSLNVDVDAYLDRMMKQCRNAKEATVTVYLYKNKLAAILMEANDDALEIQLRGGEYRVANLALIDNDKESLVIKTENSGTKVERILSIPEMDSEYRYSFDTDSGDLLIRTDNGFDKYDFDLNVKRKKEGLYLDIDYFDMGDTYFGGKVVLSKGATIKEMSGETFDVGTADEEKVTALTAEIFGVLMQMMGW